jgi:hypothetical protein
MADFFISHRLEWNIHLGFIGMSSPHLLTLQGWNYFFIIGGLLSLASLRLLKKAKEEGEVKNKRMVVHMRTHFRGKLRTHLGRNVTDKLNYPATVIKRHKIRRMKLQKDYRQSA